MELTHISLFAGIGGIDLAAEWAGFRTILFVEIDKYCQRVLRKHWPVVPIIGDIRDATREAIMAHAQSWEPGEQETRNRRPGIGRGSEEVITDTKGEHSDGLKDNTRDSQRPQEVSESRDSSGERNGSRTASPTIPPVTLITGGFPCQPVSTAGKQRGKEDDRWLWPEMLRVISEIRPTWVVAENVTGLLHLGFHDCISDLEGEGYETIPFVIPACGVNAPHRRDRIFIVANARHNDQFNLEVSRNYESPSRYNEEGKERSIKFKGSSGSSRGNPIVANTQTIGTQGNRSIGKQEPRLYAGEGLSLCGSPGTGADQWAVEPELDRVAYGIPNGVDRLKCLGNAVVPQQIYPILKAIADIENQIKFGERK